MRGKHNARRFAGAALVLLLATLMLALAASACGGGGEEEATPAGGETPGKATAQATTAAQPKYGGTLHYATTSDFATMDIHIEQAPSTQPLLQKIYNGLLYTLWDTRYPDPKGPQIVGDLAKSWEQPDATTYVFHLNEGVKFQNISPVNGRECTAEDVKYSYERMLKPPAILRSQFAEVTAVEAVDKYTVKFTLSKPSAPFLAWVAYPWAGVIPKELVDQNLVKKQAVGTGPFILEKVTAGVGATLKKNPDFFRKDADGNQLPYLDEIDWPIIKDSATSLAAFRAKKIDVGGATQTQLGPLRGTNPDIVTYDYQVPYFAEIDLNCTRAPLNDVRVRQAIKFGSYWKDYADVLALGQAEQCGPLATLKDWSVPASELPQQDIEKAKQLLADAGYANGLKLVAKVTAFPQGTTLAPVYQDQMSKIGIDIEIQNMETLPWMVDVYSTKRNYETSIHYHYGYTDPDGYLYSFFKSDGAENSTGYSNATVDDLLDKQRSEVDPAKRKEYLLEIQRILIDESPFVWLHTTSLTATLQPTVHGWLPQPLFAYDPGPIETMWLD